MNITNEKIIVCITGSVWTGSRRAPRHMLVKDGFLRPQWFTTYHPVTDAQYRLITPAQYHMACANNEVLAHMKYGSDFVGIMVDDFESTLSHSRRGVLIVGPQEIIAQISQKIPQTVIFTFKDKHMELSPDLAEANQKGQLHRIDVSATQPGAWSKVYKTILEILNLSPGTFDD